MCIGGIILNNFVFVIFIETPYKEKVNKASKDMDKPLFLVEVEVTKHGLPSDVHRTTKSMLKVAVFSGYGKLF